MCDEGGDRFALVWSKCGDVNQPNDLRIVASLRDNHAPIGVAHENHRARLCRNDSCGDCNVVVKRDRRIWTILTRKPRCRRML